jgi:long-chain acyl-CoA synthetase
MSAAQHTDDLLPACILRHARERPQRPAIWQERDGVWAAITWARYVEVARGFAGAMIGLGCAPGAAVAILASNRSEWVLAAVGAWFARGVPTGVYQTLTAEQAAYVIHHCEASVVVVEGAAEYRKVSEQKENLPHLKQIVVMAGAEHIRDPMVVAFEAFVQRGLAHGREVDQRLADLMPADLATLIYTSGTTGPPKGVMLTHANLAFVGRGAVSILPDAGPDDSSVSYLPLAHIAEQAFSLLGPATAGYAIWMCPQIERLKEVLVAARPTFFLAVPRVWEKFKTALEGKLAQATGAKGAIARWALSVGRRAGPILVEQGPPTGWLGVQQRLAKKLFQDKLAAALGLDRLKLAVTGAAPIGKDVLDFFLSCGIIIHEVYGQSEDTGPTSFNLPGKRRLGTVGLPFPGVEVRIAPDGEIIVRGPNVFAGYFKQPEATAETLIDGWLHSGDIGEFDAQGFLRITDRKKDLIITAGGKNVAPQNIEKLLKAIRGVGQAVVIGDRQKFLVALLTVDPEQGPALAKEHGWPTDPAALAHHAGFRAHVEAGVAQANQSLARYETIKHFAVLPVDFTVEGGELTPTQKVKRPVVASRYAAEIAALYAGDGGVG